MSPNLKAVEEAGIRGILRKSRPFEITQEHFFEEVIVLKQLFAQLIGCKDPERIAIVPSVSYGMATVALNLAAKPNLKPLQEIVMVQGEFPSDVYAWDGVCASKQLIIKTVQAPTEWERRGESWNERVLEAISERTCMVVVPHVHWTDGTKFDLVRIAQRARQVKALMVVDGTQSVGALPFDVQEIQPDALVCGGYKCMMGGYSLGVAYYGEYFDTGSPIEQSWMNRLRSDDFRSLVDYESHYRPKAYRYNVGEQSNFVLVPMLIAAIRQLLEWQPASVQAYTQHLCSVALEQLKKHGYWVEESAHRAHHLFGLRPPTGTDVQAIQKRLQERRVYVSLRGDSIRVSPHLYNDASDVEALVEGLLG